MTLNISATVLAKGSKSRTASPRTQQDFAGSLDLFTPIATQPRAGGNRAESGRGLLPYNGLI
ncbi:hypothetical protein HZ99_26965 [Pseudomonas fluorescens]|nr:hypothetical protein HZ99_26965 [Pseudomonas fluorescens]